jgi:ABC-type uncharacterized transport system auxiliary subunit
MTTAANARRAIPVALAASALLLAACGPHAGRTAAYRMNPTPELQTLGQTRDDVDNRLTITNDTNFRALNEDIGRFFLMDRPSRLTPTPIPY